MIKQAVGFLQNRAMAKTRSIHGWCVSSTTAILLFFLPCIRLLPFAAATNTLSTFQSLRDGRTLVSTNKLFELGFFSPGQSKNRYVGIWLSKNITSDSTTVVWVANRENPIADSSGLLVIDGTGNLLVLDGISKIRWSSSSAAANAATSVGLIAVLQDTGNLVLREGNSSNSGRVVWESFDDPSNTLLPGMKIGINLTTGKTQILRSWKTDDDPAPGSYAFGIDPQSPDQFFIWRKSAPYQRVIFWNGSSFDSLAFPGSCLNYSITSKEEERYFTYSFLPSTDTVYMGLVMESYGVLNSYSVSMADGVSINAWSGRDSMCDSSGACGPNSSCNENGEPMCKCLPGFKPKSARALNSGNWLDGCMARIKWQCGANDGFLDLKRVKLVDPTNTSSAENSTICRRVCDSYGCSCRAYAFKIDSRNSSSLPCRFWFTDVADLREVDDDGLEVDLLINNTILLLNCSSTPKNLSPLNCNSSSPCHSYIQQGRAPCFYSEICCGYGAGGLQSSTSHKIGISDTGCSSYSSIVNLRSSVEVRMWQEGVVIEWDAPPEPVCESEEDCNAWTNSSCLSDKEEVGRKRCFCNGNFQWDPLRMNCRRGSVNKSSGKKRLLLVIIITAAIGILLSMTLIYGLWRRKNKRKEKKMPNMSLRCLGTSFHDNELMDGKNSFDILFIDFECIVEATENFSDSNELGKGGFGPVYQGKLPGGQEIAVKRLSKTSGQGLEEFKNEVLLIAKLQHRNLVRILGYCIEGDEKMLIHEYMPNKSLDFFLFDPNRCALLGWDKCFNIILGIARGLLYLHQDSRLRIIHRDLKTSNILLDNEMNPKISDFGMARIFGGNQTEENTNRVVGTFGYMPPECAANGLFSMKSDVFSFGIVLLEIVSGEKNFGFYNYEDASSLTGHVSVKMIIHPLLKMQEIDRPWLLFLPCLTVDGETATLPTPKKSAFYMSVSTGNSDSNTQMNCSINEPCIKNDYEAFFNWKPKG
ncbi:G-type lectin S-receptor-like serine/threonine-protein kinase At4g27290 [Magnolia sinica]|uniref:G-type lectin S-receptor-like serine/threonine-protein kinase At4g27290 n=1 Tax=Magnolia sinica TaxID=86752 RepID=UPI00265AC036|nr:G-type lectin S-receptor-like serine/threonine-protein kinase At4g27290 [Magnolia sinica]